MTSASDFEALRRAALATRAIIVHYGDATLTRRAIRSVLGGSLVPAEMVVVDNGPGRFPDPDPAAGSEAGPLTAVVHPDRNMGFASGVMIGLAAAPNPGLDYAWLLNNDAVAEQDALVELLAAERRASDRALISSLIEDEQTGEVLSDNARFMPWRMEARHASHRYRPTGDAIVHDKPSARSVPYLPACSVLLPLDLIRSIDGLDTTFFMYGEDVDLSLRAVRAGYALVTARGSVVIHRTSSGTEARSRERMVSEACLRLTAKHYQWLLPIALFGALVTSIKRVVTQRKAWPMTARLLGYQDAFRRRSVS